MRRLCVCVVQFKLTYTCVYTKLFLYIIQVMADVSGSRPTGLDFLYSETDKNLLINDLEGIRQYLTGLVGTGGITNDHISPHITKIINLKTRITENSADNISYFRDQVEEIRRNLINQLAVVGVTQHQLDELNRFAGKYGEERVGKQRMIALNSYYGKKYMAQKELMQLIILTCVPLLILALLVKYGTIPANIASMVGAVILVVGIFFIGRKFLDIMTRSKLNFDEYDWQFSPKSSTSGDVEPAPSGSVSRISMMGCYNGNCCDPATMDYDEATGKCIVKQVAAGSPAT